MKRFFLITVLVFSVGGKSFCQNYSLDSTRIHVHGNPGDLMLASLVITNTGSDTITFQLKRIVKNLPSNWNSCYCYPECLAQDRDTLTFSIAPFGSDSIVPNFGTDSVPGIGYITTVLFVQEGESLVAHDTVYYTGSTLNTSVQITEENYLVVYPNPAENLITIIYPQFKAPLLIAVYSITGKEVLKTKIVSSHSSVNISSLSQGVYFLGIEERKEKFTFIKK